MRLCLVPRKFEGKYEGKKIEKNSIKKKQMKENNIYIYIFEVFNLSI